MASSRRKKRIPDDEGVGCSMDESRGAASCRFARLGEWRTWARMVLGYALALAYITLTAGLAWLVVGLVSGTWGVPQSQGFHGSWPAYLLLLSFAGSVLTPVLLMTLGILSYGAYLLGQLCWPLPDRAVGDAGSR